MEIKIVNAYYLNGSERFINYILHMPYQKSIFEIEDYFDKENENTVLIPLSEKYPTWKELMDHIGFGLNWSSRVEEFNVSVCCLYDLLSIKRGYLLFDVETTDELLREEKFIIFCSLRVPSYGLNPFIIRWKKIGDSNFGFGQNIAYERIHKYAKYMFNKEGERL